MFKCAMLDLISVSFQHYTFIIPYKRVLSNYKIYSCLVNNSAAYLVVSHL